MYKHLKFLAFLFFIAFTQTVALAAKVDTVETFSTAMNKTIKAVVVTPDAYAKLKSMPVVYLLHGAGGNYKNWVDNVPEIKSMADQYQVILVCADGNVTSWYFDSPVDKSWKYETYVATELVNWVDQHYKTIKDRSGRAITGLSMGGHGALYLAFKHQDVFGAAGSTSGGVDFRPFPKNWKIAEKLGQEDQNQDVWDKNTVTNMIGLLTPGKLALIIDCGTEDFFYKVNCEFHDKLLAAKIPHDFILRPGMHNWPYWSNSIRYQMLFMHNYFASQN
jgi:S-formylglutathione hydrolase FrmB